MNSCHTFCIQSNSYCWPETAHIRTWRYELYCQIYSPGQTSTQCRKPEFFPWILNNAAKPRDPVKDTTSCMISRMFSSWINHNYYQMLPLSAAFRYSAIDTVCKLLIHCLLLFVTFKRTSLIRLKQQIRHRKTKAHDQCQQKCLHTSDQTCNGISWKHIAQWIGKCNSRYQKHDISDTDQICMMSKPD